MKLLLQGRLYITSKRVCFSSFFNQITLFGKGTKIVIPYKDIIKLEKKQNALIFNNSINIITKTQEFFLTSFIYRDKAFSVLESTLNKDKNPREISENNANEENVSEDEGKEEMKTCWDYQKAHNNLHNEINPELEKLQFPLEEEKDEINIFLNEICEIENERMVNLKDLDLFSSKAQNILEEETATPIQIVFKAICEGIGGVVQTGFGQACKNYNYQPTNPSPPFPLYFTSYSESLAPLLANTTNSEARNLFLQNIKNWPAKCEMEVSFKHSLEGESLVPFLPKFCEILEKKTIYPISSNFVVIDIKGYNKNVPYGNYFYYQIQWQIRQKVVLGGENSSYDFQTSFLQHFRCVFFKNTIMKGKIKNASFSKTKASHKIFMEFMNKYIEIQRKKYNARIKELSCTQINKPRINNWNSEKEEYKNENWCRGLENCKECDEELAGIALLEKEEFDVKNKFISQACYNELQKHSRQIKPMNRIINNQRILFFISCANFFLLLILIIILFILLQRS